MTDVDYIGPFRSWDVVVHGHVVPYLRATPLDDQGSVHLNLDRRFGIDLSEAEALKVIPFLADCIAVALGYTCHPCPDAPDPPRRREAAAIHNLTGSSAGAELS